MGSMLLNIGCATAAWALSACVVAAAAQSERAAFVKFKGGMMPKIGQKITVVGILSEGKQGFWFAFNNWGAYGYAAKESGIAKENDLHSHFRRGQTVKVTGTLRYFPGRASMRVDEHSEPEHFFFDAGELRMSHWSNPSPRHPKERSEVSTAIDAGHFGGNCCTDTPSKIPLYTCNPCVAVTLPHQPESSTFLDTELSTYRPSATVDTLLFLIHTCDPLSL
jgi:hypothetical protein